MSNEVFEEWMKSGYTPLMMAQNKREEYQVIFEAGQEAAQPQWYAIETAPKDGTEILTWDEGVYLVSWYAISEVWSEQPP